MCNKLKSWWHFLETLNIRKKNYKAHNNILELKAHFKSNLSLIQWFNEKDWIKSMCIKYITYIFSMTIGTYVCDSWHITKLKKMKKNTLFKKSFFFLREFFFPIFLLCIYCTKNGKNPFFDWISTKILEILYGPKFSWCISISFTTKKSLQNSTHNLSFKIYLQFFIFCDVFISTKIYLICSSL